MKRSVKLISKHLQSRDKHEPWVLSHFQRLNSAGHDYKGQLSSAYGQSGFGGSIGADIDFGGFVAPFVHLELGVNIGAARTAHTLILIHRVPTTVWRKFERTPSAPTVVSRKKASSGTKRKNKLKLSVKLKKKHLQTIWHSNRPIALAFMRGSTWEIKEEFTAAAWAGVGNAFDDDETGLAAGAKITGGVRGVRTRLMDNEARHYDSVYDSPLANDVDDMIEDSLKKKAAAWLTAAGKNRFAAGKNGVPFESARTRAKRLGLGMDKTAQEFFDAWDAYDTPAIDRNTGGLFGTTLRGLRGLAVGVKSAWDSHNLQTDKLIKDLESAIKIYQEYQTSVLDDLLLRDAFLQAQVAPASITDILVKDIRKTISTAELRISEGQQLKTALERAKHRKLNPNQPKSNTTADSPWFYLSIDVFEGRLQTQAGAKLVLPAIVSQIGKDKPSKVDQAEAPNNRLRATINAKGGGFSKRVTFRYNAYSPPKISSDPILQTTQDTVVNFNFWEISLVGAIVRKQKTLAQPLLLATMNYRAVIANWFRNNRAGTVKHAEKALPNGSGVCFGMSVLMGRVQAYANEAKRVYVPKAVAASLRNIDKDESKTEKQMLKQLRVNKYQLREFIRSIPDWLFEDDLEFGDAFVIESAFAFVKEQDLDFSNSQPVDRHLRKPNNLMSLPAYKALEKRDNNTPQTELQVIRLRYRIRSDADRSRNLFTLGLNPINKYRPSKLDELKDYAADVKSINLNFKTPALPTEAFVPSSLQSQFGLSAERVTRVGTEGIITVHEHFYPERYDAKELGEEKAAALQRQHFREIAEMVVPPVQLFGQ